MGLASFERRLERLVEGAFAKAFRSGLQPVEVGRRLTREMDLRRTVAPRGTLAPNHFDVWLSLADRDRFAPIEDELIAELISVARDHARSEGYLFLGPVSITLDGDDALSPGTMRVNGEMRQAPGRPAARSEADPRPAPGASSRARPAPEANSRARPAPEPMGRPPVEEPRGAWLDDDAPVTTVTSTARRGGGVLVLPDGRRIPVGDRPVALGRLPGCEVVLSDPNVSRHHAEVRAANGGTGWVVTDLGSTNGTKLNGITVSGTRSVRPGDEIRVGATSIRFEAG